MNYVQLIQTYPRYLGFGFLHAFFSSVGQTFLIALFIPHIQKEFSQTTTAMGSYYGIVTIASALLLFLTGPWIDKVNLRKYSFLVGMLVALGCFVLSSANYLFLAIIGLFMIRHGGQGLMSHTAFTTIARYFTTVRGKALAITALGLSAGLSVLPWAVNQMIIAIGWRKSYFVVACSVMFLFFPLSRFFVNKADDIQHPDASQDANDTEQSPKSGWGRKEMLLDPYFWMILPYIMLPPFLVTGLFFFQKEVAASKSWSHAMFTSTFLGYGLAAACSSFASGPIIDRFGGKTLVPCTQLPMVLGFLLWLKVDGLWAGYLLMLFAGISMGVIGNVNNAMWVEVYGQKKLGAIKSFVMMLMVFSTAMSPAIGGWMIDHKIAISSMMWGAICLSLGASCIAFLAKPPSRAQIQS